MPLQAITRKIGPNINACELTHLGRHSINIDKARAQHAEYEKLLADLGCELLSLSAELDLPDSVFVEDTAVVLDEAAIITRPGARSRRPETETIARALQGHRDLLYIEKPGTLDGGDVLLSGKTLYVGLTSRSNQAGCEQLGRLVAPFGYQVQGVEVSGCLHLKTAVTQVADNTLLLNPNWVDSNLFGLMRVLEIDPREPFAANALRIKSTVVYSSDHPWTRQQLEDEGVTVAALDVSELAKAEGAVTCCSLIFTKT